MENRKITHYYVLRDVGTQASADEAARLIGAGWQPFESMSAVISKANQITCCQAWVRYEDD